jgi:hypothetical protein
LGNKRSIRSTSCLLCWYPLYIFIGEGGEGENRKEVGQAKQASAVASSTDAVNITPDMTIPIMITAPVISSARHIDHFDHHDLPGSTKVFRLPSPQGE